MEGVHDSGFVVPSGEVTAEQAAELNRVEEKLPSTFDITKADDKLEEITKNVTKAQRISDENLPNFYR